MNVGISLRLLGTKKLSWQALGIRTSGGLKFTNKKLNYHAVSLTYMGVCKKVK